MTKNVHPPISSPGAGNSSARYSGLLSPVLRPYLAGVGAILCWASLAASVGESLREVPPEAVLFHGLLTAGLSLGAWEVLRGRAEGGGGFNTLKWPGWRAAAYGVYGIWGYHTLLVMALFLAPKVEANILNYTWSLWIVIFGSFVPGHRFSLRVLVAALTGFAGVALVIGWPAWERGWASLEWSGARMSGLALALGAGVCWGSFTAFMRRFVPPRRGNMAMFCLLSAGVALVFLLARGVSPVPNLTYLPLVIYIGLVPLGLSFVLWEFAARGCNVQVLGFLSFFTPVLSTTLLAWTSGEGVGISLLAGLALILGGAFLGSRSARIPDEPPAEAV